MKRWKGTNRSIACAILLFIAIFNCIMPASSQVVSQASTGTAAFSAIGSAPFIQAGPVTFAFPFMARTSTITYFNERDLVTFDNEYFLMDFPAFTDGTVLGPTIADGTAAIGGGTGIETANVLPFGLVDLAMPSLHQRCDAGSAASNTTFYSA